jgi:hypothetical protein
VTGLKSGGRMADAETNPMRVDTSLLQGITAANQPSKASSTALKSTGTTTSFSSQLKSATDKETTKAVPGTNYAEILTGPRAGLYVNTGGGARDGEAFVLVKHDNGREDHIYGTGKDRTVVSVGGEKSGSTSKTDGSTSEKAPTGETTKQVEGRAFHDIITGSRKGLYLNTSGNARDGMTFVLVKRDGREFHIYGTGKDREIFSMLDKASKKTSAEPTETTPDTTSTTDTSNTGSTVPTSPLVTDNPS